MTDFTWKQFFLSKILLVICLISLPDSEHIGKMVFIIFIDSITCEPLGMLTWSWGWRKETIIHCSML